MKLLLSLILLLGATVTGLPQACGYIYAKFEIKNSKGDIVEDAKIRLLGRDDNRSIVNEESEIAFSKVEKAFKLKHGMCGSHNRVRLVIEHSDYLTYDELIDLPLNTAKTEHKFVIVLRKMATGIRGRVLDPQGAVILGVDITAVDSQKTIFRAKTNADGQYAFELTTGEYTLEINNDRALFCPVRIKNFLVPELNGVVSFDIILKEGRSSHGGEKCTIKIVEF